VLLLAAAVVFGTNSATLGTNSPTFASTYNLAGGTLAAASIVSGGGTFNAASNRRIVWTGGVIQNYDAATDLVITGSAGTGGSLTLALGTGTQSFVPTAGRSISVGANTIVSGSGGLSVDGLGTVVLSGSASYQGATAVNSGSLLVNITLGTQTINVTANSSLVSSGQRTCSYDFNQDENTDLVDAQNMAQVVVGLLVANPAWLDGDFNGDENFDLTDAQQVAQAVVTGTCQ
jgi:autotransporter-associated beta strand protein